jgi:hypothetical protein
MRDNQEEAEQRSQVRTQPSAPQQAGQYRQPKANRAHKPIKQRDKKKIDQQK